jgi:hypothetical protein
MARIGKHEVACEFLSRAIELYLRGDSPYSAIHLAGAAEEIFSVLIRHLPARAGESTAAPIDQMKDAIRLISSPSTPEEGQRIEAWAYHRMTEPKNSIKHMRGLQDGGIEFDATEEATDAIDRAISSYIQLGNRILLPAVSGVAEFDSARRAQAGGG